MTRKSQGRVSQDHEPDGPLEAYARTISSLVHDLRTPLTSIIGAASSLQSYADRFDEGTRTLLLRSIVEEAEHLDRLLNNLSLLAKCRSGALMPQRQDILLGELLSGVIEKARASDDAAKISVANVAIATEMALAVDPGLLQGAFLNMFDLAERFCPKSLVARIEVDADDTCVRMTVVSPVSAATRHKLRGLLEAFGRRRTTDGVRASDFILLEAATEVVHIHGGRLLLEAPDEAAAFKFALNLPI